MPWLVEGLRPGSMIFVEQRGMLVNGKLDDAAADVLRARGMRLRAHTWREPEPSAREYREMIDANLALGVMPLADGRTKLEGLLRRAVADIVKPMRKQTHVSKRTTDRPH